MKRRIGVVVHEDGPGGGPVAVVNQLSWLKERYETHVFVGSRGKIAAYCAANAIPFEGVLGTGKKAALPFWWALRRWRRRVQPELLISFGQWGGAVAGCVARAQRVKHVYVTEWPSFFTDWDVRRVVRNRLCEAWACRGADAVVALAESVAYEYLYRKLVTEAQLHVIPNPVDVSVAEPRPNLATFKAAEGFSPERRHVVSVSRLSSQKCLHWLIEAWPRVLASAPDAMLWVVGDGERGAELLALATLLSVSESVRFVGARSDARSFMQASDAVVSTTMYEAHGIAVIEAMACGKAIVSNRVAGVMDSVTDGVEGFLVAPGDREALAARIALLLKDRALAERMGANGRKRAADFSVDRVMPRYIELYDRVLASRGVSSRP